MIRIAAHWSPAGLSGTDPAAPTRMLGSMGPPEGQFVFQLPETPTFRGGLKSRIANPKDYYFAVGNVQILLDGSLYNRRDLCETLGLAPDTPQAEILFHGYRKWGTDLLVHLEGRFAFIRRDDTGLWAARDRFGVKPLYYAHLGNTWYFASEQKAFLELPAYIPEIDNATLFDFFLRHRSGIDEPEMLLGIRQLMPGTWIRIDATSQRLQKIRWYHLRTLHKTTVYQDLKSIEYQSFIDKSLQKNIQCRRQFHSTKSVGTFLSGGLDSSLLAAIASQRDTIPALTAAYPGQAINEADWALRVVEHLGLPWTRVEPTVEELRKEWVDFYYSQDLPTFSFGTYNQYRLMQAAADTGLEAVFDGQAADALFAGHDYFLPALWEELLRTGQFRALRAEIKAYGSYRRAGKYLVRNWLKYRWLPERSGRWQLRLLRQLDPALEFFQDDFLHQYADRLTVTPGPAGLNQMLFSEYTRGEVLGLLKCLDRAGSRFGVDPLTPFVDDHHLIEQVFRWPGVYKIRFGQTKHLLRQVARRYLPPEVIHRPDKMGLVAPNNNWMRALHAEMRPYFEDLDPAVFRKDVFLQQYDDFFGRKRKIENFRVYKFMAFALWRAAVKSRTGRDL